MNHDNRKVLKIPAYNAPYHGYPIAEGYVCRTDDEKKLLFRPDRGSGGYALYNHKHTVERARGPGEHVVKGLMVFVPLDTIK